MAYFIVAVQVLSGIALLALVLLHVAKGEGLGGIGGQASLFSGPSQAEAGLNKLTWITAGVFMLSSALVGWGIIRF
ncbi:MAG: preprotein translocase subunit SecG [Candidatus Melainabacteria bacterium]|nr:preprotein translocase subunit SecG [Candidatus Melainabacteria bacterium]